MVEGFSCIPVHEGAFVYERHNFMRCLACSRLVTEDHVRASARAALDLSGVVSAVPIDGNDVQRMESAQRVSERLRSVQVRAEVLL